MRISTGLFRIPKITEPRHGEERQKSKKSCEEGRKKLKLSSALRSRTKDSMSLTRSGWQALAPMAKPMMLPPRALAKSAGRAKFCSMIWSLAVKKLKATFGPGCLQTPPSQK
jgi:hypothetical protein